jgi:hypothetical protein
LLGDADQLEEERGWRWRARAERRGGGREREGASPAALSSSSGLLRIDLGEVRAASFSIGTCVLSERECL